jgi:threonine aldolase
VNFASDNVVGAAPEVLAALAAANQGPAIPYGADPWTERLEIRVSAVFEHAAAVFPVSTGSAANALALAALSPPYGAIYSYEGAHVQIDECGAPEFYTGGAKLVSLPGAHGKLTPETVARALADGGAGDVHHVQPAALSITEATEAGTVYTPVEVRALAAVAHAHGLRVHMDGARLANAVVALGCAPADVTWRAGVDVVSLGGTKNGAIAAEAVIFFDPSLAATVGYRRKRGGHLLSKMRYCAAQLDALLTDGLWLRHAAHANRLAARLGAGLARVQGARLMHPVDANEVFATLPMPMIDGLLADGFYFYRYPPGDVVRFVTAFDTVEAHVDALLESAHRHATGPRSPPVTAKNRGQRSEA